MTFLASFPSVNRPRGPPKHTSQACPSAAHFGHTHFPGKLHIVCPAANGHTGRHRSVDLRAGVKSGAQENGRVKRTAFAEGTDGKL